MFNVAVVFSKWVFGPLGLIVAGIAGIIVDGSFWGFVDAHQVSITLGLSYIITTGITAMANPWDGAYNWFYRWSHAMVGVVDKLLKARLLTEQQVQPPPSPPQEQRQPTSIGEIVVRLSDSQPQSPTSHPEP